MLRRRKKIGRRTDKNGVPAKNLEKKARDVLYLEEMFALAKNIVYGNLWTGFALK